MKAVLSKKRMDEIVEKRKLPEAILHRKNKNYPTNKVLKKIDTQLNNGLPFCILC
jgi:uncharacterized protein YpiB (UPF0302 family)